MEPIGIEHKIQIPNIGMHIHISPFLPTEETVKASNIETKKEVNILTGKMIHCIKLFNNLYVSKEIAEKIKLWKHGKLY